MLYIFGGLPGTGKSSLAQRLARYRQAVYLRIDSVEQTIRNLGHPLRGPEGYAIGYTLAEDNLRLGQQVVVDSVNPLPIPREAWRDVAARAGSPFLEIEIMCLDRHEHRHRVESRQGEVVGLTLPTWASVVGHDYHP